MEEIISKFGNYIEQVFPLFNIRFIAINDGVDSFKNPSSVNTILIPFKNLINDEYSRDTSIKIRSSLNSKRKKGEFIGAFCPYGYIKDKNDKHKLIVDEESAKIVRKIFDWSVNYGMGKITICHKLNDLGILNPSGYKRLKLKQNYNNSGIKNDRYLWTPSTIRNILTNEVYIGNTVQGKRKTKSYKIHKLENVPQQDWVKVENTHTPIIKKEIFEKSINLEKTDTRVENTGSLSLWAGLLKCGDCGMAMNKKTSKSKNGKVYEYYICGTYKKKSKFKCSKHNIKSSILNEAILTTIQNEISLIDIPKIIEKLKKSEPENLPKENLNKFINEKETEIEKLKNLKRLIYEDWKNGSLTEEEYKEYKNKYNQDIEKLEIVSNNINNQNEENKEISNKNHKWIEDFEKNKNILELDRSLINELIELIEVFENDKIKIHFKFTKEFEI